MKQGDNGQREDLERYALPRDLRRRLIEASGRGHPVPTQPDDTNVVDFKRWRERRDQAKEGER
jgi:hypothetical protein